LHGLNAVFVKDLRIPGRIKPVSAGSGIGTPFAAADAGGGLSPGVSGRSARPQERNHSLQ
jgi:hypothetical protein